MTVDCNGCMLLIHNTVSQNVGETVGMSIIPDNIHIMNKLYPSDRNTFEATVTYSNEEENETEEEVTETVVLAPWWHPNKLYNNYDCKIELLSDEFPDVHRITYNNKSFLHIRSYVGATNVGETVLLLSFTKCKKIIFVGSVGSISNDVNIGDLIIPSTSVSGEAFSSYMYETINKESLHKEYHPIGELYNATTNYLRNENIKSYYANNMALLQEKTRSGLFGKNPIYTKVRDDNPTRYMSGSKVTNTMAADGCIIEGEVENSILFRGVKIEKGAKVKNCILMQDTVVKEGAIIEYLITDKEVTVSENKEMKGTDMYPIYIAKKQSV